MVYIDILNSKEVKDGSTYLHLRVIQDSGVSVVPDMDIAVTRLSNGYNHFFSAGDNGLSFKLDVIILKTDKFNDVLVTEYINNLFVNMVPVRVVTDAMDVPNGDYIITKNDERKQTRTNSTIWSLEFTKYVPLNLYKSQNNNKAVLNAIKKSKKKASKKKKKASKKKTTTKTASTVYKKLSKCNYKTLVYSKKKKTIACVKTLQQILYKQGCLPKKQIDGWYGPNTVAAVKKYQKKYNKKHKVTNIAQTNTGSVIMGVEAGTLISPKVAKTKVKNTTAKLTKQLTVNGKVDKPTYNALCKGE